MPNGDDLPCKISHSELVAPVVLKFRLSLARSKGCSRSVKLRIDNAWYLASAKPSLKLSNVCATDLPRQNDHR